VNLIDIPIENKQVRVCLPPSRALHDSQVEVADRAKQETRRGKNKGEGVTRMEIFRLEPRAGGARQPRMTHHALLSLHNN
jgi:hypothetical protein